MVEQLDPFTDLLCRAKNGDAAALGEVLDQFRPYLRILAERQIGTKLARRTDASDVVQQSFLKAHRGFADFNGTNQAELAAWLTRILDRDVAETIRNQALAQKRAIDREQPLDQSGLQHPPAQQSSPSQRAMKGEQAVRLAQMLDTLPAEQRQAVQLRHLEGWKLAEIADELDKSTVAVAGLIKRGMATLKGKLRDQ